MNTLALAPPSESPKPLQDLCPAAHPLMSSISRPAGGMRVRVPAHPGHDFAGVRPSRRGSHPNRNRAPRFAGVEGRPSLRMRSCSSLSSAVPVMSLSVTRMLRCCKGRTSTHAVGSTSPTLASWSTMSIRSSSHPLTPAASTACGSSAFDPAQSSRATPSSVEECAGGPLARFVAVGW
jgi:hypothetical protein